ncbi:MAG: acetylxylan esterase [Planctomycetes bacterium]|nr:acetylxylan esterase [Planctomycetota bacterium]
MKLVSTVINAALVSAIAFGSLADEASAQGDFNVLSPEATRTPPRKMLSAYLLAEAQKHFDARKAEVAGLKTPDDVRKRQAMLRTRMMEALGGFPEKTPLNPQVVGKDQRDRYRIEKVIYESRPHHHVTATLYLPDGKGPHPGCIMPIGHSSNGKAAEYIQRGSILLAKNGIAVLAYDPIGQWERRQLLDDQLKAAIPNSTNEHTLVGVGALLVGSSTATYRIWDGIRSLDYLASRPEIDAKRLGCTGCSGGGTLTSYLMALDDRILAAAPSCYITTLERLFATIGPQDAEQNITGQVALGIEHADYLTMRTPRPTLIATATRDFFDIQGSWTTFREATQIYGLMGHGERVNLVEYNTGHGYPKPQREAVTRFMRRWLMEKDDAVMEPAFAIVKDADLQCTRSGQVLEDFKGKSAFHLNLEAARRLQLKRLREPHANEDLIKDIRRLIALPDTIKPAKRIAISKDMHEAGKLRYRKCVFETEPGILVPALHFIGNKGPKGDLVLYVHGDGKSADAQAGGRIQALVEAGTDVLAIDVRGMGETAPGMPSAKPSFFGTDFKETYLALHLNRPLLGQRVFDVLTIAEFLRSDRTFPVPGISVWGIGNAAPIAMHAALLDPRIRGVVTHRGVLSWEAVVRSPIGYNQLTNVVPGALKTYDLPDLAMLMAPRSVAIQTPVDARLQPVTQAALDEAYVSARQAYRNKNAAGSLILTAGEAK